MIRVTGMPGFQRLGSLILHNGDVWRGRPGYRAPALIGLLSLVIALTGCSTPGSNRAGQSQSTSVDALFVDAQGNSVPLQDRPKKSALQLGVIAGSIAGNPSQTLLVIPIGRLPAVKIDFDSLASALKQQATPMTTLFTQAGLHIEPVDTRFVRVSTLPSFTPKTTGGFGAEFADVESKHPVTLVYFDRPCKITGVAKSYAGPIKGPDIDTNITVEKPGLIWLELTSPEPGRYSARLANPSTQKMIAIAPRANIRNGLMQIN